MSAFRNRYLLMRHGHSQANREDIIVSDPAIGIERFGLSTQGEAQLAALTDQWPWPAPTRIRHSDFLRTTQTATAIAAHFGLAATVDRRLRERFFGDFDGHPDTRYPQVWAMDAEDPYHRHAGVESVAVVARRMQAVLDDIEASECGETVLLVSHGDPLQILLTALARRPLSEHRLVESLLPASITLLESAGQ